MQINWVILLMLAPLSLSFQSIEHTWSFVYNICLSTMLKQRSGKKSRKKGEYTHNRALTALGERPLVILQNKEQDQ